MSGQLVTILAANLFADANLPLVPLLSLVTVTALTNSVYWLWLRRVTASDNDEDANHLLPAPDTKIADRQHSVAFGLMVLDLATLTAMLYCSGGADNPFSFFYFVNLAVGGVMLRPRFAWQLATLAIAGYTLLIFASVPIVGVTYPWPERGVPLRRFGLFLAFSTCSSVVTYFVTRTAGELKSRESQLLKTQAAQAANERLEGLTTLAAGAAHELATPLSTIDVIVRELSCHLEDCEKPPTVDADLRLIDGQLEMCRQILQRMRSAAGDSMAQRWDRTTVGELIDATLEGIRDPHRVDVIDGPEFVENQTLWLPQEAVAQAVRNLIHNGLDASGSEGRVRLEAAIDGTSVRLMVTDSGQGMTADVLGRAGDPFFTTKEPGRGIGLGLFLTRNVVSKLGGEIEFRSQPHEGTQAVVTLPCGTPRS